MAVTLLILALFAYIGVALMSACKAALETVDPRLLTSCLDGSSNLLRHLLHRKVPLPLLLTTLEFVLPILGITFFTSLFVYLQDRQLPLLLNLAIGLLLLLSLLAVSHKIGGLLSPHNKKTLVRLSRPFFLLTLPLAYPFARLKQGLSEAARDEDQTNRSPSHVKDRLADLARSATQDPHLERFDQQLIQALPLFWNRHAGEVMVPRHEIFALPANLSLSQVKAQVAREGFSRIPIYTDNLDQIDGVLLYKELLQLCLSPNPLRTSSQPPITDTLDLPLKQLIKPILYAPETQKISHLLQKLCHHRQHMAVVVDEYGTTRGLVTVEDIIEELVGEIVDEHDNLEEERLHHPHPGGGWLMDAKIGLVEIEKISGVTFPTSPDYHSLGGFIFHEAGSIPATGWKFYATQFTLEVITSSPNRIHQVHFKPQTSPA